jgi:hypothetical protein
MNNGSRAIVGVNCVAQGDGLFLRVRELPSDARRVEPDVTCNGYPAHAILHSESGHHHVVDPSDVIRYESSDPGICYLQLVSDKADVVHMRSWDTHGTVTLLGGKGAVWKVARQRQSLADVIRPVQD